MLKILGEYYFIDINKINEICKTETSITTNAEMNLNIPVYNVINMCCEALLSEYNETDENLGIISESQLSISFKFAFNTLIHNEILKTSDNE